MVGPTRGFGKTAVGSEFGANIGKLLTKALEKPIIHMEPN